MDMELFLSKSKNRRAVKTMVQRALADVEPKESEVVDCFIEPLMDEAANGEISKTNTADWGGGFGGTDLMVLVIVPVIVQAVSKLLDRHGRGGMLHLKKRLAEDDTEARLVVEVSSEDVNVIVRHTRSPGARKRVAELTRKINAVLIDYLKNEWDPNATRIIYQDFAISLEPNGEHYRSEVLSSSGGSAPARFVPPWKAEELHRNLVFLEGLVRGGDGEARPPHGPARPIDPKALGAELFEALFTAGIRDAYRQRLGAARRLEQGLRVRLILGPEDEELCALPWELLYDESHRHFLSHSPKSPVVRYLRRAGPRVPRIEGVDLPLRVLVVDALPRGARKLDVEGERDALMDAFAEREDVRLIPLPMATAEELRRAIRRDRPHILHFMGHGEFDEGCGEGSILLTGPGREEDPLTGEALAVVLSGCDELRLVVLNACQTAALPRRHGLDVFSGVATALAGGGLPAVVAMQFPISDGASVAFGRGFYDGLAAGDPVEAALAEGRQAIFDRDRKRGSWEWATPVLYLSVEEGRIF